MSAQSRSDVLALLDRHGVAPRKALGQHFLADPNLTRKIASVAAVGPGSQVVEIGAGTGTLTSALADTGARVIAFEVDRRLEPVLTEVLGDRERVEVRYLDVTKVDLGAELGTGPWTLVSNLPYNIGTPLLLDVLRGVPAITRLVVMLQLEVAERLVAGPGTEPYGLPSVVAALHAEVALAFRVPPQVFVPAPEVGSAVVTLARRAPHPRAASAIAPAAAGFGQRRKTLRRSLRSVLADPVATLSRAGIDPGARPERLAPEDFLRLAEAAHG